MEQENKFLAMWDCNGLECLFDISDLEYDGMISSLKGEASKAPFNIGMMMMRARYNSQRAYEIYSFTTTPSITEDDIRNLFEEDPQNIVDSIRKLGNKIYSDYTPSSKKMIA